MVDYYSINNIYRTRAIKGRSFYSKNVFQATAPLCSFFLYTIERNSEKRTKLVQFW